MQNQRSEFPNELLAVEFVSLFRRVYLCVLEVFAQFMYIYGNLINSTALGFKLFSGTFIATLFV